MRIQAFFLSSILVFSSLISLASSEMTEADCPSKDFSDKLGPIRDQGNASQCFAFVSADLIGYAQGRKPDNPISAMDVGVNYMTIDPKELYKEAHSVTDDWELSKRMSLIGIPAIEEVRKKSNFFSGGKLRVDQGGSGIMAIAAYNRIGKMCDERKYKSQGSVVEIVKDNYIKTKLASPFYGGMGMGMGMGMGYSSMTVAEQRIIQVCDMKEKSLADFKPVTQLYEEVINKTLRDEADRQCEPREKMKPMMYGDFGQKVGKESGLAKVIAGYFGRENTPVGIGYDPTFLVKGRNTPYVGSSHTSSLVGSRWNSSTKQCEFKLRNSWGTDCKPMAPEYRENCEKDGGYIWITAEDLNNHADYMYAVKPR